MKTYRFYYNGVPITKKDFLASVPEDWEDNLNEDDEYSWGYYRACKIESDLYEPYHENAN